MSGPKSNSLSGPMFVEEEPDYAQAENDDFFLPPESVTALESIGEGQFGAVYKGILRSSEVDILNHLIFKPTNDIAKL